MPVAKGDTYAWDNTSTYVQNPPYFRGMQAMPKPVSNVTGARVLGWSPSLPRGDAHAGRTETSMVLALRPSVPAGPEDATRCSPA